MEKKKFKIFLPTFTIILMLVFGAMGGLAYFSVHESIKDCTAEVEGVVEYEKHGDVPASASSEATKYLSTGKYRKRWIAISVETDGKFRMDRLYAGVSHGHEGDHVKIHYNPSDPDDYYIGDISNAEGYGTAIVLLTIAALMLGLSLYFMIHYSGYEDEEKPVAEEDLPEEVREWKAEKEKRAQEERTRKAKEKLDRKTKKYTAKYTNSHIRSQIQSCVVDMRMTQVLLCIGLALCAISLVRSIIEVKTNSYVDAGIYGYMKEEHPLGFVFGLTFIVIGLFFSYTLVRFVKCMRPACSGKKYQPREIDRLANDIDTKWLFDVEVLATPVALIGLNCGLTVVDYADVRGIHVETVNHKSRTRKWKTYKIYIETKSKRKMLISESERQYGYRSIETVFKKRGVEYHG